MDGRFKTVKIDTEKSIRTIDVRYKVDKPWYKCKRVRNTGKIVSIAFYDQDEKEIAAVECEHEFNE